MRDSCKEYFPAVHMFFNFNTGGIRLNAVRKTAYAGLFVFIFSFPPFDDIRASTEPYRVMLG